MLSHYEVNLQGVSHKVAGIPCQDSYAVRIVDQMAVLVVADGVGSEEHSDVGSRIAAEACADACLEGLGSCFCDDDHETLLRRAFCAADDAVRAAAESDDGLSVAQMDTTLCAVIWDARAKVAHVGQAGDSGAAFAHSDGSYGLLTEKQSDEYGRVWCLCASDHWEFSHEEDVASVMLCTDGILDAIIAPPVLKAFSDDPECNHGSEVDHRTARAFLHPRINPEDEGAIASLQARAECYLENYDPAMLCDDKTCVVCFDFDALPDEKHPDYYLGPDWPRIDEKRRMALYASSASWVQAEDATTSCRAGSDSQDETRLQCEMRTPSKAQQTRMSQADVCRCRPGIARSFLKAIASFFEPPAVHRRHDVVRRRTSAATMPDLPTGAASQPEPQPTHPRDPKNRGLS